jgi:hypothetical protein
MFLPERLSMRRKLKQAEAEDKAIKCPMRTQRGHSANPASVQRFSKSEIRFATGPS